MEYSSRAQGEGFYLEVIPLLKTSYESDISNVLDGRTENAVRKYFQKRIREEKKEKELVNAPIQGNPHAEIVVASEKSVLPANRVLS